MSLIRPVSLLIALLTMMPQASAITVFTCVGADGSTTYSDRCPQGTRKTGERKLRGAPEPEKLDQSEVISAHPITLYRVAQCDACDLVSIYLEQRQLPFKSEDVADDIEVQERLRDLSGSLTVPLLAIGEQTIQGYNKQQMDSVLQAAGYVLQSNSETASAD